MNHPQEQPEAPMTCRQAQRLIEQAWLDEGDMAPEQRPALEAHLRACQVCSAQHREMRRLAEMVRMHWGPVSHRTRGLAGSTGQYLHDAPVAVGRDQKFMTIQEGWEDLQRQSPSLALAVHRQQQADALRRSRRWIGAFAAAAGILLAIGVTWLAIGNNRPIPSAVATGKSVPATARVELLGPQGRVSLVAGQPVITDDQSREVLLGGMHRVVMNRRTEATFTARGGAVTGSEDRTAYEIQLARGEMYVEVVPGHPMSVRTDNALLRITGTKFNVKAGGDKTELVLLKGSVRFSRSADLERFVDVFAGQQSVIAGDSTPTPPRGVDALAATEWARQAADGKALAGARSDTDVGAISISPAQWLQSATGDLDSLAYCPWRDGRLDDFRRDFPWIFRIQDVLKQRHDIDADYLELLMISGDIWQFRYPLGGQEPMSTFRATTVERIAEAYRLDKGQLLAEIAAPPDGEAQGYSPDERLTALRRWSVDIATIAADPNGLPAETLTPAMRAATYLANTRTAAYLWIRQNPDRWAAMIDRGALETDLDGLATREPQAWLERLRDEVRRFETIRTLTQELVTESPGAACDGGPNKKAVCLLEALRQAVPQREAR